VKIVPQNSFSNVTTGVIDLCGFQKLLFRRCSGFEIRIFLFRTDLMKNNYKVLHKRIRHRLVMNTFNSLFVKGFKGSPGKGLSKVKKHQINSKPLNLIISLSIIFAQGYKYEESEKKILIFCLNSI
jgi:hypothetical protein